MRIEDGKIKPCSTCFKARQVFKNAANRLAGNTLPAYQRITMSIGAVLYVDTATHTLAAAPKALAEHVGKRVYIAGKNVIDVAAAMPLGGVGIIASVEAADSLPTT